MVDKKLGALIISAVVDTGCAQTMMKVDLAPSQLGEEDTPVSVLCMHWRDLYLLEAASTTDYNGMNRGVIGKDNSKAALFHASRMRLASFT